MKCAKCGEPFVSKTQSNLCVHCEDTKPTARHCATWDCRNIVTGGAAVCEDCEGKTRPNKLTKQAFIERYAKLSGVTVEWVNKRMVARECRCGATGCRGWSMETRDVEAEKRAASARARRQEEEIMKCNSVYHGHKCGKDAGHTGLHYESPPLGVLDGTFWEAGDAPPFVRCTAWSMSLAGQCDLAAGHEGLHDSAGDGFHQDVGVSK